MALYVTVKLEIDENELERLELDPESPETATAIAEGILARVYPVAGCDPDEFLARRASVRVLRERAQVGSDTRLTAQDEGLAELA